LDDKVYLHLLGQAYIAWGDQTRTAREPVHVQPRPLRLLAYLALDWKRPHRREELQDLFWPHKPSGPAANNLRQALWHLRQALPPDSLCVQDDTVQWNPAMPPWVDALAFEAALEAGDLDTALNLYAGPFLPDAYDEWAQLERERLHLRYLGALEMRAERHYEAQQWEAALSDAETLLAADSLNEAAARLVMACHWALGQRESARRCYDAFRQRARAELQTDPLPETTTLYQRILRGEAHPERFPQMPDATFAAQRAHLSLLETLGAFRQGLEQATAWASEAGGPARAVAMRWQGRFYIRLGDCEAARAALTVALPQAASPDQQALILADLATAEMGVSDYASSEAHFVLALRLSPLQPATRLHLLSSLGGLLGRMGRPAEARITLEEAVRLARDQGDPARLAVASGNLGILLIGQKETLAAEAALHTALDAARRADAHWLTAHLTGHLGVLAEDQNDLDKAAEHYQDARALTKMIGDQRSTVLWTLNLGVLRHKQERCDEAVPLLVEGKAQAAAQGARSLEAGALIFYGSCLVSQGQHAEGLESIERGLALAQAVHDQERILMGYLHRGRALATMGRADEARSALQHGLGQAETSQMHRLGDFLRAELECLPPPS
jgi:DNA-binding SARP family transcriptional activator